MPVSLPSRLHRRDFIKLGVLGGGLTLADYLRLDARGAVDARKNARSGILVFLNGGPSHQDMFDMKPEAPAEYRGEFRPIATNVSGVEICEHLPKLARCADQYAVVRGVSHNLAAHGLGKRYLMTGNRPNPLLEYPVYGSVASRELPVAPDLPPFVCVDYDDEGPGFLGLQYGALNTGEKPRYGQPFSVRGVTLDEGQSVAGFQNRKRLLDDVDNAFRGFEQLDDEVRSLDRFAQRAHDIIVSPRTREAFDLSRETPAVAGQFGTHEFGQSFLLAYRLVAAGVRFVTILVDGWDTHQDNFNTLKKTLLPQFDQGMSALLASLADGGLLESTAVMTVGEFGRTPKVNGNSGRDHWARAQFALLAGGDVRGARAIGASDDKAAEPAGDGYTPDDLAASFYHNLGIDPATEYPTGAGRPITLIRDGRPIRALFGA
jgi:hypothetical protein